MVAAAAPSQCQLNYLYDVNVLRAAVVHTVHTVKLTGVVVMMMHQKKTALFKI